MTTPKLARTLFVLPPLLIATACGSLGLLKDQGSANKTGQKASGTPSLDAKPTAQAPAITNINETLPPPCQGICIGDKTTLLDLNSKPFSPTDLQITEHDCTNDPTGSTFSIVLAEPSYLSGPNRMDPGEISIEGLSSGGVPSISVGTSYAFKADPSVSGGIVASADQGSKMEMGFASSGPGRQATNGSLSFFAFGHHDGDKISGHVSITLGDGQFYEGAFVGNLQLTVDKCASPSG